MAYPLPDVIRVPVFGASGLPIFQSVTTEVPGKFSSGTTASVTSKHTVKFKSLKTNGTIEGDVELDWSGGLNVEVKDGNFGTMVYFSGNAYVGGVNRIISIVPIIPGDIWTALTATAPAEGPITYTNPPLADYNIIRGLAATTATLRVTPTLTGRADSSRTKRAYWAPKN